MKKEEYTKHYYDPFCQLDQKWQEIIDSGYLTVSQAAELSGFSRQHIYNLISNGVLNSRTRNEKTVIPCKVFVRWFSSLTITHDSPLGYASYSLKGLINLTGMGRGWVLKLADRYPIPSYYCGVFRRFHKQKAEEAWNHECFRYAKWITADVAIARFGIGSFDFYSMVAMHYIAVKHRDGKALYSKRDILKEINWRENHGKSINQI